MKKLCCIILLAVLMLNLSACGTKTEENTDKYIIQTTYYQIYEQESHTYKYTIKSGEDILAEGTTTNTPPRIDEVGDGIIRLHLNYGTNANTVKYFNVNDKTASKEFYPYTVYSEYIDVKEKEFLIAYTKPGEAEKVFIEGFFDSEGLSTTLSDYYDVDICEELVLLNTSQLYIDYYTDFGDQAKTVFYFDFNQ